MIGPWAVVSESAAVASVGPGAVVYRTEHATYAVGAKDLVVVLEPGDRPGGTGVQDFEHVVLMPPFPGTVLERLAVVLDQERQIYGFVRLPEGCVALGPLHPGMREFHDVSEASVLLTARLSTRERLPYPLLDRVRPTPVVPAPSLAWLDRLPADPAAALGAFVDAWFADVPPVTGTPGVAAVAVPRPLAEFYRLAAGRREVLGGDNRILRPDELRRDEFTGLVAFGVECQGGFWLLMEPAADDPLVHYGGLTDELLTSREPMSGFLLQFVISEQSYVVPYHGYATVGRAEARRFVTSMRRVPLQPMRFPTDPTFHYVSADGFLAEVSVLDEDDKVQLSVGARHRHALRTVRDPGFEWCSFNG